MHDEPHFELESDLPREHRHEVGIARGHAQLAGPDAEAGAQGGQLRRAVAVRSAKSSRETASPVRRSARIAKLSRSKPMIVVGATLRCFWASRGGRDSAGARRARSAPGPSRLRDERLLDGADHPHRDVGVAPRQILVAVAERELDGDLRMALAEFRQDRRQHFRADEICSP